MMTAEACKKPLFSFVFLSYWWGFDDSLSALIEFFSLLPRCRYFASFACTVNGLLRIN